MQTPAPVQVGILARVGHSDPTELATLDIPLGMRQRDRGTWGITAPWLKHRLAWWLIRTGIAMMWVRS